MKDKIEVKSIIERYEWLLFGGLLLLALGIHIFSTFGSLIWTSDSFHYWAASRSFQSERVFLAWDGGTYIFWPPLFPIILSFFNETTYHIFHIVCFLSSLLFIYLFFKKLYKKDIALISLTVFILSVYPYLMSSFLWSETIFTFLLFSGLYYYQNWLQDKAKNYSLILSSILLALMCLQRNAGVFIIVGLSVYCFIVFLKEKDWKFLIKMAIINLLIITPNIIWNNTQKIYFTEDYDFSNRLIIADFIPNLETFSVEIIRFFIPIQENAHSALLLIFGIIILTSIVAQKSKLLPLIIFTSYLILFLILPEFESSETGRFLAPITPIIILQLTLLSKEALSKFNSRKIKVMISIVLVTILLYNMARTAKNVSQWNYRSIHHPKSAKIFF
ncbi:glycosyltransferase family 39 protein [Marivirga tractuosa]|uniref:ArnT family glycosyltransferase n=1 Tax=Marivirga tractuosa TaxID=1006 RepID=UPI0035D034E1